LRWVHRIHEELGIPISGSNGIFDHRDVIEFIMAGANVVQVGSILMVKGLKWLPKMIDGVEAFMDEHGYETVEDMIGLASKKSVKDYSEQFSKNRIHAVVNDEKCKNPTCNICIQVCFYEALSQTQNGTVEVHENNCIGCELCLDVCPFDAITMNETSPQQLDAGFFNIPEDVFEKDKFQTARNNMETIRENSPKFNKEPAE